MRAGVRCMFFLGCEVRCSVMRCNSVLVVLVALFVSVCLVNEGLRFSRLAL